jgi:DNA-binding transcriptional LysR family regulator
MRITIRQLEIFRAVCQEQTVTAAAQRIGLSQAATSQALAELENLLERKLFDRHGRRILLNAAGRQLLPAAAEILDRVQDIEGAAVHRPVRIRIHASLTAGNYMLPPHIARFAQRHRDYQFHVALGNTGQVVESLLAFESDAGWIEGLLQHPDLKAFPWRDDELVIVARPGHPLAGRRASPDQLNAAQWVLREEGSGTRAVLEGAMAGRFRPARPPLEFGGIEAIKNAVLAGAGVACISRAAVTAELANGSLRRIRTPWFDLRRQITVLLHREKYLDAGMRRFLLECRVNVA